MNKIAKIRREQETALLFSSICMRETCLLFGTPFFWAVVGNGACVATGTTEGLLNSCIPRTVLFTLCSVILLFFACVHLCAERNETEIDDREKER